MFEFESLVDIFTLENPHFEEICNNFYYGEYSAEQRIWEHKNHIQQTSETGDTDDEIIFTFSKNGFKQSEKS